MNIELKPCPFCGGEAELRDSPNSRSEEGMSFYEVRCKKCGVHVTGESFNFWIVKYNREKPQDQLSAVERWNKRAYEEDGRKTARWVPDEISCTGFICSNPDCWKKEFWTSPYCPNCGARMEGEDE